MPIDPRVFGQLVVSPEDMPPIPAPSGVVSAPDQGGFGSLAPRTSIWSALSPFNDVASVPLNNPIAKVAYGAGEALATLPKRAIEFATTPAGLRREDFTDIPPDTSVDPNSPLGSVGANFGRIGWQPGDELIGTSLETAANVMGGTSLSAPARIGEAAIGAGPVGRMRMIEQADQAKELANLRRAKGWATGKSAPGWEFTRPDPPKGSFAEAAAQARAGFKSDAGEAINEYLRTAPANPLMTPDDWAFIDQNIARGNPALGAGAADKRAAAATALLDMSPEARMARAAEQGFDVNNPIYHGTSKDADFNKFRDSRHGTWTIDDPRIASEYAMSNDSMGHRLAPTGGYKLEPVNTASRVMPLYAKPLENPFIVKSGEDIPEAVRTRSNYKKAQSDWFDQLRRAGHDGVQFAEGGTRVDFNNANLRSQFAAFDPAKAGKSTLLGAGAADRRAAAATGAMDAADIWHNPASIAPPPMAIDAGQGAQDAYAALYGKTPSATAPAAPAAPGRDVAGGAGGGDAGLSEAQAAAARRAGARAPLEGLPTKAMKIGDEYFVPGPISSVHDVAEQYMRAHHPDRPYTPPTRYHPLDPEHSKAIAQAFEDMPHTPNDPATKASYDALIKETQDQYNAIKKTGLKIEPIPADMPDPYAANPRLAAKDVADNNHLWYFPTDQGFGSGGALEGPHPMMRDTGEKIGDKPLLANDMFRIVHDYFGHLKEGHGFRAAGEDNAWRTHSAMYSDLARPAMTTETRGQNSWVNYGPHGETNRTANAADTIYADQKVGLMPEWTMRDRGSPEPIIAYHGTPYSFEKFDPAQIGAGEGNQAYGHGLYFAGHEPVSEWYRHQLAARRDPVLGKYGLDSQDGAYVGIALHAAGGDAGKVIDDLESQIAGLRRTGDTDMGTRNMIARRRSMINYLSDPERAKGHMYQVAIDARPEQMLDWDAPLKAQPEVLDKMRQVVPEWLRSAFEKNVEQGITGANAYHNYAIPDPPATGPKIHPYVRASNALRDAGVKGIQYLDQGSRMKATNATRNYVTFDAPRILRKYAVPGMVGAGGFGSLAPGREER